VSDWLFCYLLVCLLDSSWNRMFHFPFDLQKQLIVDRFMIVNELRSSLKQASFNSWTPAGN